MNSNNTPGVTVATPLQHIDAINELLSKASGIINYLGHTNAIRGELADASTSDAAWAARDFIVEAKERARKLFEMASNQGDVA